MPQLSETIAALIQNSGWRYEFASPVFTITLFCGDVIKIVVQENSYNSLLDIPQRWFPALVEQFAGVKTASPNRVFWANHQFSQLFSFLKHHDDLFLQADGKRTPEEITNLHHAANDICSFRRRLKNITEAERRSEINIRNGQEILKKLLMAEIGHCIITGITESVLLRASHIIPWKDSCDDSLDCLNPENVLLLAVNYDALFDSGYISFDAETGSLIKSVQISTDTVRKLGIDENAKIPIHSTGQARFLKWHSKHVLRR